MGDVAFAEIERRFRISHHVNNWWDVSVVHAANWTQTNERDFRRIVSAFTQGFKTLGTWWHVSAEAALFSLCGLVTKSNFARPNCSLPTRLLSATHCASLWLNNADGAIRAAPELLEQLRCRIGADAQEAYEYMYNEAAQRTSRRDLRSEASLLGDLRAGTVELKQPTVLVNVKPCGRHDLAYCKICSFYDDSTPQSFGDDIIRAMPGLVSAASDVRATHSFASYGIFSVLALFYGFLATWLFGFAVLVVVTVSKYLWRSLKEDVHDICSKFRWLGSFLVDLLILPWYLMNPVILRKSDSPLSGVVEDEFLPPAVPVTQSVQPIVVHTGAQPEMALPGATTMRADPPSSTLSIVYYDDETQTSRVLGGATVIKIQTRSGVQIYVLTAAHVFKGYGIGNSNYSFGRILRDEWLYIDFKSLNVSVRWLSTRTDVMLLRVDPRLSSGLELTAAAVSNVDQQKVASIYAWHRDGFHRSEGRLTSYHEVLNGLKYDGFTDRGYSGSAYFQRQGKNLVVVGVHYGRHEKGQFNLAFGVGYFSGPPGRINPPPPLTVPESPWSEWVRFQYEAAIADKDLADRSAQSDESFDDEREVYRVGSEDDSDDADARLERKLARAVERERHGGIDIGALRGAYDDDSYESESVHTSKNSPEVKLHPAQLFQLAPRPGGPVTLNTSKATMDLSTEIVSIESVVLPGPSPSSLQPAASALRWSEMPDPSEASPPPGMKPPSSAEFAALQTKLAEMAAAAKLQKKEANILKQAHQQELAQAKREAKKALQPKKKPAPESRVTAAALAKTVEQLAENMKQLQLSFSATGDPIARPKPNT
jgi:hypothetical protein